MRLRQRVLLLFAAAMTVGAAVLYFVSRDVLLSSFRQLENEHMHQDLGSAVAALDGEYLRLGNTADDYAYWDQTYAYMADPKKGDISSEFQNGQMKGLGLDLVVFLDGQESIVFAKAYDHQENQEARIPLAFLQELFLRPQTRFSAVVKKPLDGIVAFPAGPYLVSTRPILTSQKTGESRGELLFARKLDSRIISRVTNMTRTSVGLWRLDSASLPPDYRSAAQLLHQGVTPIVIQLLSEDSVAGYVLRKDIFAEPALILRVDTPRSIYQRGKLSQWYLFATALSAGLLASVIIILFLQRFVLSPLSLLESEVSSIGKRKAANERVFAGGRDEFATLGNAINGMLEELEKSQKDFLILTENIHQIFWIREARSGRYQYVSAAFEKIWERPSDSLVRNPESWMEKIHLEDSAEVAHAISEQSKGRPSEAYFRIIAENGDLRWLWERTFPIFDGDGRLLQVTGLTEDITELKRHEQALLQSQTELEERVAQRTAELAERSELVRLLVDSTPGAMYGIDHKGLCTFCNPACVRAFGYDDASELLGRHVHSLAHHTRPDGSPFPPEECPILIIFITGKDTCDAEDLFWRRDGSSFPVEFSSRQVRRKGKVVGAVVTFTDITERKQNEMELRQSQRLETVGRLAAGIAHEINTPIQFVGDNTHFLIDSFREEIKLFRKYEQLHQAATAGLVAPALLAEVSAVRTQTDWPYLVEEIPRALEQMLEGLHRVSTIVRGMKDFSHVDRSNEKAPGDLNRALESTLIVSRNELKYVADVETQFAELPLVLCHLGDLNQVFLNLLVNAAHAVEDSIKGTTARGKICVRTRLDGDFVEVSIADSGTGIPEEVRHKIFDPFFTTKIVGKGTGQGLAIARAIVVDKHGGTLNFVTEMGKGTTFFVRLPLHATAVRQEELVG